MSMLSEIFLFKLSDENRRLPELLQPQPFLQGNEMSKNT